MKIDFGWAAQDLNAENIVGLSLGGMSEGCSAHGSPEGTIHAIVSRWSYLSKQATCIIILGYGTEVFGNSHVARHYQCSCRALAFPLLSLKSYLSSILSKKDILSTDLKSALEDSHLPPFK